MRVKTYLANYANIRAQSTQRLSLRLIFTPFVLLASCGNPEDKRASDATNEQVSENMIDTNRKEVEDYVMTAEHRQRYIQAKTQQQRSEARRRLVEQLQAAYGGIDVSVSGRDASYHGKRFHDLMVEWNPVHFSVDDLKTIAGPPSREEPESIEYRFDYGDVTATWRFSVSGNAITGVEYIPGD